MAIAEQADFPAVPLTATCRLRAPGTDQAGIRADAPVNRICRP